MGNPGVEASIDHTSKTSGFDILNLSPADANTFQANVCLTSLNAPCPAPTAPSLTASPNPITVTGDADLGMATISWNAPGAEAVEVRVNGTDGPLLVSGGDRGSAQTGPWVADGMTFYLQDVSGGKPLTEENTLATAVVRLQRR
ncbi:MAG: hypothetical protein IT165_23670 [Bryobacterales bacterium]|nr:hypothetical protein [Bryobacterales bacterium]